MGEAVVLLVPAGGVVEEVVLEPVEAADPAVDVDGGGDASPAPQAESRETATQPAATMAWVRVGMTGTIRALSEHPRPRPPPGERNTSVALVGVRTRTRTGIRSRVGRQ